MSFLKIRPLLGIGFLLLVVLLVAVVMLAPTRNARRFHALATVRSWQDDGWEVSAVPVHRSGLPDWLNEKLQGTRFGNFELSGPIELTNFPSADFPLTSREFDIVAELSEAKRLFISGARIDDSTFTRLGEFKSLIDFTIRDSEISDHALVTLADCPHLKEVYLVNNRLTDAGIRPLGRCRTLTSLGLEGRGLTDQSLNELRGLTELYRLFLLKTGITGHGFANLSNLPLTQLFLQESRVTDEGLREIAKIRSLRELNLSQTDITDVGLKELVHLKELRYLNLTQTRITLRGLQELRAVSYRTEIHLSGTAIDLDEARRILPDAVID